MEAGARREWIQLSTWRQALRSLGRRPAFLASAVLTLGFGTGITAAVFTLVDTVLNKPLPFPDSDRLVTVRESSPSGVQNIGLVAPGRLEEWQRLSQSFAGISGSYRENQTDTSGAEPERLEGLRVQPRFFAVFAMPPIAGRHFTDAEETFGGPGAAIISEPFWTRRFQRSPAAIGRALNIGGRSYEIVGVMPATFTSDTTDVWLPSQTPPGLLAVRNARFVIGIGRLKPGVTIEAGQRELGSVQEALARDFPKTDAGWSVQLRGLKDARIGDAGRGLVIVLGAVASLWVIAVANIAGLTLVQMQRRERELALRVALGASRVRVIATVVREGLLIALVGGGLGALLTGWLLSVMPAILTRTPRINEVALDWRALSFVIATSVLAAFAFSLIPALTSTRSTLNPTLTAGTRTIGGGHHGVQRLLVVAQVALSVLLVGSATLLLRSYSNLTRIDIGFDPSSVITFHVGARWDEDRTRIGHLQTELLSRLEQLPHVQAAGLTNFFPATGATLRYEFKVSGLVGPNDDGSMTVGTRMIGGGYLRAIRAQLVAGSWCPALAIAGSGVPFMALVNQRFVEVFASGQDVVGRIVTLTQAGAATFTIAGVVGNLIEDGHAASAAPYIYTCSPAGAWPDPEYVVRTSDPRTLTAELRRIVGEIEPGRAVFGVRPLQAVLDAALDRPRLDAAMLSLFASAAVTLAAIGLYSLFMLIVSERAREMALRLAIGAEPAQLIRLVVAGAGRLLAGGLVLGIVLTIAADRLLRGVLFGVSPFDAVALAASTLVLAIVAAVAVTAPAIKVARIAPVEALRGD
jgi:putative ABC transport system permease protein